MANTPTPFIQHLARAAGWVGVGALVHSWLLGPDFNQDSLWSWGYLLAWPIPLFFWVALKLLVFLGYAAVLSISCGLLWVAFCWATDRQGLRTGREDEFTAFLDR